MGVGWAWREYRKPRRAALGDPIHRLIGMKRLTSCDRRGKLRPSIETG